MSRSCVLSVAGLDPSSGAGVYADLWTFARLGVRGAAVVTAITAQNRTRVSGIHPLPVSWVREQLAALLAEGVPVAIKIGMLGSAAVAREVARFLSRLPARVSLVLDPVLRATAGIDLIDTAGIRVLLREILPRATLVTPNVSEAERLLGRRLLGLQDISHAAEALLALGARAVFIKGGDRPGDPIDVFRDASGPLVLRGKRIRVGNVRGTGCRFAAAAAVHLSRGIPLRQAVRRARSFVRSYILSAGRISSVSLATR